MANFEHHLRVGMEHTVESVVSYEHTAEFFGAEGVVVFATPCMILIMEQAAYLAVKDNLADGCASVGTTVDIAHLATTPVGMKVKAKAVLREIDDRRLVFDIEAWNEKELIGRGTHERFLIFKEKFMGKTNSKLDQ